MSLSKILFNKVAGTAILGTGLLIGGLGMRDELQQPPDNAPQFINGSDAVKDRKELRDTVDSGAIVCGLGLVLMGMPITLSKREPI